MKLKFHPKGPAPILRVIAFQLLPIASLLQNVIGITTGDVELPTSTPRFGACVDLRNGYGPNSQLTCAVGPANCPATHDYIRSNDIDGTLCHTPHHVEIGRCASELDLDSCSLFASSCTDPANFVPLDTTCTIVEDTDTNTDRLTHYPHCQTKSNIDGNTPRRCVLSEDECITGREDFHPTRELPKSPCYCHDVPTGMCYSKYISPPAADTSFCAISDSDCPTGYDFMPAFELTHQPNPPHTCRLCDEADYGNYDLHETVVASGACYSTQGQFVVRCVLEATDCCADCGEVFWSSAQVREKGGVTCPAEIFSGGKCTSGLDEVECTNKKESCHLPVKFFEDETCSLHKDLATGEPTYFPFCYMIWATGGDWREFRCVWDASECDVGPEEYMRAALPGLYEGCGCEHVVTGACREGNGEYYCAVSKNGCSGTDTYITSLETNDVGLDCRLCQPKRVLEPPTRFPTTEPHGDIIANHDEKLTFAPTTSAEGIMYYDDDDYTKNQNSNRLTFAPTPTAMGSYDSYDDDPFEDDEDEDEDESKYEFAIEFILVGSIGGSFLISTIATYAYYRQAKTAINNSIVREGNII